MTITAESAAASAARMRFKLITMAVSFVAASWDSRSEPSVDGSGAVHLNPGSRARLDSAIAHIPVSAYLIGLTNLIGSGFLFYLRKVAFYVFCAGLAVRGFDVVVYFMANGRGLGLNSVWQFRLTAGWSHFLCVRKKPHRQRIFGIAAVLNNGAVRKRHSDKAVVVVTRRWQTVPSAKGSDRPKAEIPPGESGLQSRHSVAWRLEQTTQTVAGTLTHNHRLDLFYICRQ
jgi:hypothetical protein